MNSGEAARDSDAPREREAGLGAAILRISASLDVDTVLREVVDSARALTGARYGVIATVDDAGQPRDFFASGFTEAQHRKLTQWPDAAAFFQYLRSLAAPLRLPDLTGYTRSLGHAPFPIPSGAFQAMPMRYRDAEIGGFFLGGKEGGFTDADEELLVLFASQAATAIANARTHRDEQRARADLEALVETSPVGVIVLDAATSRPRSLNREAKRILGRLHSPDRPLEDLREMVTSRLADGREVTLDELRSAETMRAAEVELSVPDGRSIRMLINVTPIRIGDGAIESVVVTLQDLAPLEEMERARTEFLATVSHELREPLAAIKGSAATARGAGAALDPAETLQFLRIIEEQADRMDGLVRDLLDAGRIGTGTLAVAPAPAEVAVLVDRARTAFQGAGRHAIAVDLAPDLPRVMADERRIVQVLGNLLANAARHSPQASTIRVAAVRDGARVAVSVADEGEGVAPERLPHLFRRHGGARADGGTGLGLVICKGLVEAHGGRIRIESGGAGLGATVTFTLPVAEEAAPAPDGALPGQEGEKTPVLVVDDDPETLRFVRNALAAAGYTPIVTGEPQEVPGLIAAKKPRLVLLDLMLPGGTDGIALMRDVAALARLPVIFISAYGRDETVARALEAGAADYIVKPFSPTELVARVRAALRRRDGPDPEPFRLGELAIDYARHRVTVAGRPVRLSATEYDLLRMLALGAGGVLTYQSLLHRIWGEPAGDNVQPLRSAVKKLRRKLGDDAATPRYILNDRGLGYRMPAPGDP